MKKLIQVFAFLSLAFVVSAFANEARAASGSEVEIPFAFIVGDREYEAGKYIIKLNRNQNGSATITINDPRTDRVQVVLANRGNEDATQDFNLVFEKVGEKRVLSRVVTPNGGYAVVRTGQPKTAAAGSPVVGISDLF